MLPATPSEALRESEERFRALFNGLTDAAFVQYADELGPERGYVEVNDAACRRYGYSREELLRLGPRAHVGAANRVQLAETFARLVHDESRVWESVHVARDGREIPVEMSARRLMINGRAALMATARDLTATKRAEAALRESEDRYRSLFNALSDAAFVLLAEDMTSPESRYLEVNDAACERYGYSREELCRLGPADIIAPELRGVLLTTLQRARLTDDVLWESTHVTKDGTRFPVEMSTRTVTLGGRRAVIATARDITERKRVEAALRESEQWLRESQRISRIGSYVLDFTTGRWTSSDTLDELFGIGPGYVRDVDGWSNLVHPDDRAAMVAYFEREVVTQRRPFDREYRIRRPADGSTAWVWGRGALFADDQGRLVRMSGTIQDITERKRADESLTASEARLRTILERLPDMVFILDGSGRIEFVNSLAARFLGGTPEALLGYRQDEFFPPEVASRNLAGIRAVLGDQRAQVDVREFVMPGRPSIWLETQLLPFHWAGAEVTSVLGIVRDVTSRKRAELEHERLEAQVRQSQKLESLGVLAGGIAHDFNNLLGGLFGFIELARAATPRGTEADDCLAMAQQVFERARGLTRQLLTFAKGGEPQVKIGSLVELLKDSVAFASSGSKLAADFEVETSVALCLYDPDQIGQVVDNLVINAKQAMPEGGRLRVRVRNRRLAKGEHPTLREGDWVEAAFTDEGPGIPHELQGRIFDPFFTTKKQGTGLGLATAYSILHRHNGLLEMESEPGRGSTFRFFLPAATGEAESRVVASELGRELSGRVLVMDDDPALRGVLQGMLVRLGCEPVVCASAAEARRLLREAETEGRPYALLILDLTIPGGMGGLELVSGLRREGVGLPTLAVSGYSDDPVMAAPEHHGFDGSLAKPFTLSALAKALERVLPARR
jgi:PAS domain S-box-containing protein